MRRVLLYWKSDNLYYQFLTRITDDYIIPKDTVHVYFYEAYIINDSDHPVITEWELFVPKLGMKLKENGTDLGQFV